MMVRMQVARNTMLIIYDQRIHPTIELLKLLVRPDDAKGRYKTAILKMAIDFFLTAFAVKYS